MIKYLRKRNVLYLFAFIGVLLNCPIAAAYDVRAVNLGASTFYDGLPPPNGPGLYLQQYVDYYHTERFNDASGNRIGNLPSPDLDAIASISQFIYLTKLQLLKASAGWEVLATYVDADLEKNNLLGLRENMPGFSDLIIGGFLQWPPMMKNERPVFSHRLSLDVFLPTGKYNKNIAINPGTNTYSIEPYWAATLFLQPKWSVSWRAHYLWSSENNDTKIQPGDVFHINFITSLEVLPQRLRIGFGGYYLKQLQNSTISGRSIPNSKEQVFALGPGILVEISKKFSFKINGFSESHAKNKTQGKRVIASFFYFIT